MNSNFTLENITHKQLLQALFRSQLLFFILALSLSLFLFEHFSDWITLFSFNIKEIMIYGVIPGFIIILFILFMKYLIPNKHLDNGGIKEKKFKNIRVCEIFQIVFIFV